jgi:hypothetical protein
MGGRAWQPLRRRLAVGPLNRDGAPDLWLTHCVAAGCVLRCCAGLARMRVPPGAVCAAQAWQMGRPAHGRRAAAPNAQPKRSRPVLRPQELSALLAAYVGVMPARVYFKDKEKRRKAGKLKLESPPGMGASLPLQRLQRACAR